MNILFCHHAGTARKGSSVHFAEAINRLILHFDIWVKVYGSRYSRIEQENLWKTVFKKFEVVWSV